MDAPSKEELSVLTRINLVFRFSYTLPFVLASVCGIVCAIPYGAPWYVLVLVPAAVLFLALLVNFSNDYFDHKSGVDAKVNARKLRSRENLETSDSMRKLYWSGNQFDTGLVTEAQGRAIIVMLALVTVVLALPVPEPLMMITRDLGRVTSPLALVFIGMTIQHIGFEKIKHIPREVWFILFSCFVLRPLVMYIATGWAGMESDVRQVFIVSSCMPVSSVIGVLAKNYGADEAFCSEAIGISTLSLLVALPVILIFVRMI